MRAHDLTLVQIVATTVALALPVIVYAQSESTTAYRARYNPTSGLDVQETEGGENHINFRVRTKADKKAFAKQGIESCVVDRQGTNYTSKYPADAQATCGDAFDKYMMYLHTTMQTAIQTHMERFIASLRSKPQDTFKVTDKGVLKVGDLTTGDYISMGVTYGVTVQRGSSDIKFEALKGTAENPEVHLKYDSAKKRFEYKNTEGFPQIEVMLTDLPDTELKKIASFFGNFKDQVFATVSTKVSENIAAPQN